jgi:hypothetical protein
MTSFLSESLTVALFLFLIFGTVFFYLYSRMSYTEKRLSLMENMLLDIKMSMDTMGRDEPEYVPEPVGAPSPMSSNEGEFLPSETNGDENLYKNILNEMQVVEEEEEAPVSEKEEVAEPVKEMNVAPMSVAAPSMKVSPNYEAMIKNELVALCEKRNLKVSGAKKRADLIAALRKYDEQQNKSEVSGNPHTGDLFPLSATLGESGEGFSVDLGNAETLE